MSENQMEEVCCILCLCKQIPGKIFTNAEVTLCPGSKQSLKVAVEDLAASENLDLQLPNNPLLCLECCKKVISFDDQQRALIDNIRKCIKLSNNSTVCSTENTEIAFDPLLDIDIDVEDNKNGITETMITNSTQSETHTQEMKPQIAGENDNDSTVNGPYQCMECKMGFATEKECGIHTMEKHKIKLRYKCDVCCFMHSNESYIILHKNTHIGLTDKQCPICHKSFLHRHHCIRHMELHNDIPKYQCDKCGLGFTKCSQFNTHKLKHDAEENPIFCAKCNKQFRTINTYKRHVSNYHMDECS